MRGEPELVPRQRDMAVTTAIVQPASPRRAGGATDDRAHAGGGTRRHAASVPSMSGAAQRRAGAVLRAGDMGLPTGQRAGGDFWLSLHSTLGILRIEMSSDSYR